MEVNLAKLPSLSGKEVKCPGRAVDLRATEEKRRKMQRHLGASGASESYAGIVDGEGHEARTPYPLVS